MDSMPMTGQCAAACMLHLERAVLHCEAQLRAGEASRGGATWRAQEAGLLAHLAWSC